MCADSQLSYAELATVLPSLSEPGLALIDSAEPLALASEFCRGIGGGGVVAVLDPAWPTELKRSVSQKALEWFGQLEPTEELAATFLLGFSSGTSGTPKAFSRSSRSWELSIAHSIDFFTVKHHEVVLAPGPLATSMNLYALAETLTAGASFVTLKSFSARLACEEMLARAVTRLVVVPTILELMSLHIENLPAKARADFDHVRLTAIVCAGAPLSSDLVRRVRAWAPQATLYQYYGAAELSFVSAWRLAPETGALGSGTGQSEIDTSGSAFGMAKIRIVDKNGAPVPQAELGRIAVSSPYISDGYAWGDDQAAFQILDSTDDVSGGERRQKEPWATVNDIGFLDDQQRLHVVARQSEMMLVGGANVYPQAVEAQMRLGLIAAFSEHSEVGLPVTREGKQSKALEVYITGVSSSRRGQSVVAGIVASSRAAAEAILPLLRNAAATLPLSHRPNAYYFLHDAPLSAAGKPTRSLLSRWIETEDPRAERIN